MASLREFFVWLDSPAADGVFLGSMLVAVLALGLFAMWVSRGP